MEKFERADYTLYHGDNAEALRAIPDNSISSVITDPPYGLSREPDMVEVLRHWLAGDDYAHSGGGFMGRSWDSFVPGPAVWRQVFRVLKPGGHVFAFSGTRTYDMAVLAMRLAGFEIRDQFAWVYGSGMPKSRNLGAGWGTAAKPAWEPIVLARKPFAGSVFACHAEHGTGGLNIAACRIEVTDEAYARNCSGDRGHAGTRAVSAAGATDIRTGGGRAADGRWPANLLHDGSPEVLEHFPMDAGANAPVTGDEPSASTVNVYGARDRTEGAFHGDFGSAARFFYCGKASSAERDAGCEALPDRVLARSNLAQTAEAAGEALEAPSAGAFNVARIRKNHHPTVKPIAVARWLLRLITPPGGTTLDLYAGSGSIGAAALLEGFRPIMIELDPDDEGYIDIINARMTWALAERGREADARARAEREAAFRAAQIDIFRETA